MGKTTKMYVFKRDGRKEEVHFDKITSRISKLCYGLNMDFVDPVPITMKVISGLYTGITTQELDNISAELCAMMATEHEDYSILAARIAVSNLHKETKKQFSDVMDDLHNNINESTKQSLPIISDYHHKIIMANADRLNSAIIYDRDFKYNYFGFKSLERTYLKRISGKVVERPQHMLMRVAVGIHGTDIDAAIETYNLLSEKMFTHAPTTFHNAATPEPKMSSCFLLSMSDDSIDGIYDTLKQCAVISESSVSIALNIHCIRSKGTYIAGTNGVSNGILPMLRVYNNAVRQIGTMEQIGVISIYLEPWHADIFDFLDLKKPSGKEETRARDLLYALWIPDLFMKRVKADGVWSLMCPHSCPGLFDCWGDEFERLYEKYESEGRYIRQVKAQSVWFAIIDAQVETGTPYMMYKDACNRKSNQQNLGTIRGSNLCAEIVEYSSADEIAVCNLASIALNKCVKMPERTYDFVKLKELTKIVTRNLNKVIDVTAYPPVPEAKRSNERHRPIGIGVQGLADAFILMRLPYESTEAQLLNQQIFETMYYGALEASCELAAIHGPYETYANSPVSKGILQYDMWNKTPTNLWDWTALKEKIAKNGVRNSLLIAPMPTAATSQILCNNESFEPYTSYVYNGRVSTGEFQVVNRHLVRDLTKLDLWDDEMKNKIVSANGSIQAIETIPKDLRDVYKTVWEISIRTTMDMAAARGAFIDQSQSFNIYAGHPNYAKQLTTIHFYGWELGLKTGLYRLRTKPSQTFGENPLKITPTKATNVTTNGSQKSIPNSPNVNDKSVAELDKRMADMVCSLTNRDECMSCGS